MFGLRYLPGVVTLTLDADKCNGCGMCVIVCPHAVFHVENKKSQVLNGDACMECGACARNCPSEAISVRAGVGCATAVIMGVLTGNETCCGGPSASSCCHS